MVKISSCRFCSSPLHHIFADLGMSPLSNSYVKPEQLQSMEPFYPLIAYVCENCFLVQLDEFETPDNIFGDYAYFSSYSDFFLEHAKKYSYMMIDRFGYNERSFVVEIASNDGYLLKNFVEKKIPVLGIEPAANVAKVAQEVGVPSLVNFFGQRLARELSGDGKKADLIIGNNVFAHVPNLNDFVAGMKMLLKPNGVITMEFPHLMQLIENNLFDTIYHEHFSYYSFLSAEKIFAHHGLQLFDVEEVPTHGGSLRIFAKHSDDTAKPVTENVRKLKHREEKAGYTDLKIYLKFNDKVKRAKRNILSFFIDAKEKGRTIAGYGAPAKGNTLLNYCGIRSDFIEYTVDRSPHKQGTFLPGTHIPIYAPDKIGETRPDYIFILAWNLKDEIMEQLDYVREWGGKFVTPIPAINVYE
jgi:2-polyprenyl-3-methyl-5-hydroxy-6-metoxy-1,4-benzoquinol methylase